MDVVFREILESDLQKLLSHRNEFETRKWLENEDPLSIEQQAAWFKNGGHQDFRIIRLADVDVGLARIKQVAPNLHQLGLDLFSEHRGKGLSAKCFRHLVDYASSRGSSFELWVFLDNQKAVACYKKMGFIQDNLNSLRYLPRKWADGEPYPYVRMIRSTVNSLI